MHSSLVDPICRWTVCAFWIASQLSITSFRLSKCKSRHLASFFRPFVPGELVRLLLTPTDSAWHLAFIISQIIGGF